MLWAWGQTGARVGATPPKAGRQEVWTDVSAARLDARYKIRCLLPVKDASVERQTRPPRRGALVVQLLGGPPT